MSQEPLDAVEVSKINSQCERSSPPKFHDTRRFYADARYQSGQKRPTTAATKWRSVEHVNLASDLEKPKFSDDSALSSMTTGQREERRIKRRLATTTGSTFQGHDPSSISDDMKAHPFRHMPTVRTGLEGPLYGTQLYTFNYKFKEKSREMPIIKPSLMPRFDGVMGKDSTTYRTTHTFDEFRELYKSKPKRFQPGLKYGDQLDWM